MSTLQSAVFGLPPMPDPDMPGLHEEACRRVREALGRERAAALEGPFSIFDEELPTAFYGLYAAASAIVPAGATVVDLGGGVGAQAALFPQAARYIVVDSCPMRDPGGGREWHPRLEGPGIEQREETIQAFCERERSLLADPGTVAICSFVPDDGARLAARAACPRLVDWYGSGRLRAPVPDRALLEAVAEPRRWAR